MNEIDMEIIIGAVDSLGVALAEHGHEWTQGERAIYEESIKTLQRYYHFKAVTRVKDWTVRMGDEQVADKCDRDSLKSKQHSCRYFYDGVDLISGVRALIEYVTDSDIGGNVLGDLRRLRDRIFNEKGVECDRGRNENNKR